MTDGNKVNSIHPPLKELKIETTERQIIATPFKFGENRDEKEPALVYDIKPIYQQNNYQSQLLYTISKQVNHIDNKLEFNETKKTNHFYLTVQNPFSSTSSPLFKTNNREIKFPENETLKAIAMRLDRLDKEKQINNIDENDNDSILMRTSVAAQLASSQQCQAVH